MMSDANILDMDKKSMEKYLREVIDGLGLHISVGDHRRQRRRSRSSRLWAPVHRSA